LQHSAEQAGETLFNSFSFSKGDVRKVRWEPQSNLAQHLNASAIISEREAKVLVEVNKTLPSYLPIFPSFYKINDGKLEPSLRGFSFFLSVAHIHIFFPSISDKSRSNEKR